MTNKKIAVPGFFTFMLAMLTVLLVFPLTALSATDSNVITLKYDDYYNDYKSI